MSRRLVERRMLANCALQLYMSTLRDDMPPAKASKVRAAVKARGRA